jgi:hypothetical protein
MGREGPSNLGESSAPYSITWSARIRTDCGTVSPRVLTVLRLMTRSNFVGCSTRSVRHQDASLRRFLERDNHGEAILDGGLSELCSLTTRR